MDEDGYGLDGYGTNRVALDPRCRWVVLRSESKHPSEDALIGR